MGSSQVYKVTTPDLGSPGNTVIMPALLRE